MTCVEMIQGTGPLRQLLLAKSYGAVGYEVQSSDHYINASITE